MFTFEVTVKVFGVLPRNRTLVVSYAVTGFNFVIEVDSSAFMYAISVADGSFLFLCETWIGVGTNVCELNRLRESIY